MDFQELVTSRRTVQNYVSRAEVDVAAVREALELSLWAPNHKLTFPWVYVWIGDRARAALAELAVELKQAKSGEVFSPAKAGAARENVLAPSVLIGLGVKLLPGGGGIDEHRYHEDFATLACSVQIASLRLWEKGLGSKWSTGGWTVHERTYELLGVNPGQVRLEGALMIGQALHTPRVPPRPSLDQFLRSTE